MEFIDGSLYHIYNRGNNKQAIFFNRNNYLYFLEKIKKYISPHCNILAWILMPNHFHFLIRANVATCKLVKHTPIPINALTEGVRLLLSSYAKAIQKQESLTGSLFQQKTKSKCVDDYGLIAFHYIHQNAYKAKFVKRIEDWEFSSFHEYLTNGASGLCTKNLTYELLEINPETILKDSYSMIDEELENKIF